MSEYETTVKNKKIMDSFQGVLRVLPITSTTTLDFTTSLDETEVRTIGDNMGCPTPLQLSRFTINIDGNLQHKNKPFSFGENTNAQLIGSGSKIELISKTDNNSISLSVAGGDSFSFGNLLAVKNGVRSSFAVNCQDIALGNALKITASGNTMQDKSTVIYFGTAKTVDAPVSSCVVSDLPVYCRGQMNVENITNFTNTMRLIPNIGSVPSSMTVSASSVGFNGDIQTQSYNTISVQANQTLVLTSNAATLRLANTTDAQKSMEVVSSNGITIDKWKMRTHYEPSKGSVIGCNEYGFLEPLPLAAFDLSRIQGAEMITPIGSVDQSFRWASMNAGTTYQTIERTGRLSVVQAWHNLGNNVWEECSSKLRIRQVVRQSSFDANTWLYKLQLTPTINLGEVRLSIILT